MKVRTALLPCLLVAALSGCGSTTDGPADKPASPVADAKPAAPLRAGVTAGRTGPATTASNAAPLREIGSGGRIDARSVERTNRERRREGVGAGASCQNVDAAPVADNLEVIVTATLCLLNGERADRGLGPIGMNTKLAAAALAHSGDMVQKSYFAHDAPDGSDVVDRVRATGYLEGVDGWVVGENLAWGTGALATPRSIMQAWMDSTGHRENILRREFKEIGFGVVLGNPRSKDGAGATYTTAFGAVEGRPVEVASGDGSAAPAATPTTGSGTGSKGSGTGSSSSNKSGVAGKSRKARRSRSCARLARKARAARSARVKVKTKRAAKRCRARAARAAKRR